VFYFFPLSGTSEYRKSLSFSSAMRPVFSSHYRTGQIDKALLGSYTELNIDDLEVQLAMFRRMHQISKLS